MPDTRTSVDGRTRCVQGCYQNSCLGVGPVEERTDGPLPEVGRWRWQWTHPEGDDCQGRPYPPREVRSGTRIWYPEFTRLPGGGVRVRQWRLGDSGDVNGFYKEADVALSPDEWNTWMSLSSDEVIRGLDWRTTVVLFWSLNQQGECRVRVRPGGPKVITLADSPVFPASLRGSGDLATLLWWQRWEEEVRHRIWRLRPELRSVRNREGRIVSAMVDPSTRESGGLGFGVAGTCEQSLAGRVIMTAAGIIAGVATLGATSLQQLGIMGLQDFAAMAGQVHSLVAGGTGIPAGMIDAADLVASASPELDRRAAGGGEVLGTPAGPAAGGAGAGLMALAAIATLLAMA